MRTLLLIMLFVIGYGIAVPVAAQVKPDTKEEVIRVDTQLVDVPIAVNSPSGMPVRGLNAANFVVYEDGKQDVVDFGHGGSFLVALLDTSGRRADLQLIQRSAQDFIASLGPGDCFDRCFNTDRGGVRQ